MIEQGARGDAAILEGVFRERLAPWYRYRFDILGGNAATGSADEHRLHGESVRALVEISGIPVWVSMRRWPLSFNFHAVENVTYSETDGAHLERVLGILNGTAVRDDAGNMVQR